MTGAPEVPPLGENGVPVPTGGPTRADVLEPEDNYRSNTETNFKWKPDAQLEQGQQYEVVFWRANGELEANARSLVPSSTDTSITLKVNDLGAETHKWALWLVLPDPYTRIRRLAGPFTFTVPSDQDESEDGSSSVDTGTGSK